MTEGSTPHQAPIDWDLCVKLANHKEAIAQEVLSLVLQQLPQDLKIIQQAYQQEDYVELLRYVHKVHGALCYTGLPALKEVVLGLESLLKKRKEDSEELKDLLARMASEVERILESELPY